MAKVHFLNYRNGHIDVILAVSLSRSYIYHIMEKKKPSKDYFCVTIKVDGPLSEELDQFLKKHGIEE